MWFETIFQATPSLPLTLDFQQQAFLNAARRYARRFERLHDSQARFHIFQSMSAGGRHLIERRQKVPVLVQIADHGFGGFPDRVRNQAHAQLLPQVVAEGDGEGKKSLK